LGRSTDIVNSSPLSMQFLPTPASRKLLHLRATDSSNSVYVRKKQAQVPGKFNISHWWDQRARASGSGCEV